jgi:hypothetical protein
MTTTQGFRDRELVHADQAWWKLWREQKDRLKILGFTIRKADQGQRWLLTYRPLPPSDADKGAPVAERKEAWRAYEAAEQRCQDACALLTELSDRVAWKSPEWRRAYETALDESTAADIAARKAHRRLRRLYIGDEWLTVVALAALDGIEIAVKCSATAAVIVKDEKPDRDVAALAAAPADDRDDAVTTPRRLATTLH